MLALDELGARRGQGLHYCGGKEMPPYERKRVSTHYNVNTLICCCTENLQRQQKNTRRTRSDAKIHNDSPLQPKAAPIGVQSGGLRVSVRVLTFDELEGNKGYYSGGARDASIRTKEGQHALSAAPKTFTSGRRAHNVHT